MIPLSLAGWEYNNMCNFSCRKYVKLCGKNKEKKNFKGYSPRRQVNNLYGYCEVEGEY